MEKPSLKEHISSREKKQKYVSRMFETIAPRYDFITVFLSYGMDRKWKRVLVECAGLRGEETVLDLACGTGDITFALALEAEGGSVVGLDITGGMLQIADNKRRVTGLDNVAFNRADMMKLPYPDQKFDVVTGGYALRNVPDIELALCEVKRVLKPGGLFLSLDFGHPRNGLYRWLYLRYLTVIGSALGLALHGDADTYRYIPESLKLYAGQRGVRGLMDRVGFVETGILEFGGGIMALNYGKSPR